METIKTTHNLPFEACSWDNEYTRFRIGTCEGLYGYVVSDYSGIAERTLDILAIQNRDQGNGHFEDVLEWFEFAAKRDGVPLRFVEIMNERLFMHLCNKRGFKPQVLKAGAAIQLNVKKIFMEKETAEQAASRLFWSFIFPLQVWHFP